MRTRPMTARSSLPHGSEFGRRDGRAAAPSPGLLPSRAYSADRSIRIICAATALVLIVALALLGPLMTTKAQGSTGEGSPARQLLYFFSFLLAVASARPWQQPARLLILPLSLTLLLAWCWISLTWSIDASIAARRLTLTTILIWSLFLCVRNAGYQRTLTIVRGMLLILLVINLAVVVLVPDFAIHMEPDIADPGLVGSWRGIVGHKNVAGAVTALTIFLLVFGENSVSRRMRYAALLLAVIFLLGTHSKTSIGVGVLALVGGALVRRYNPGYRYFIIPIGMIAVVAVLYFTDTFLDDLIARFLYDREAFTGRTEIWLPLLAYIQDHPLTGSGFGSFWNVGFERDPINSYATGWVARQASGHSGYLDLAVQVGLPGLVLGVLAYFVIPFISLFTNRSTPRATSALFAAILIFSLGHNFTETSLMERDMIVHIFMILCLALMAQVRRENSVRRGDPTAR